MASFTQLLNASPEDLLRIFYRVKPSSNAGFVAKIDDVAAQLDLNHAQLICGLGFNPQIAELVDVISVLGFTSPKLLCYRRDELFTHDVYDQLSIDDVLDLYTHCIAEQSILLETQSLLPARLDEIETAATKPSKPNTVISYKMELHAIYSSTIATEPFAERRILSKQQSGSPPTQIWCDEIKLITENEVIPPGNLFFSDQLSPAENLVLIESGGVNVSMIKNRMQNTAITEAERDMLEDHLR